MQDAFARLTGLVPTEHGYDMRQAAILIEESGIRHGHGSITWPYVDEALIFGLLLDRAMPNSTRYNLFVGAGALTLVTSPIWAPVVGRAFVGAAMATPAMWDRFKAWLQAGSAYKAPLGGGGSTDRIGNITFGHGARHDVGVPIRQLH